jgi:hypothetical protein
MPRSILTATLLVALCTLAPAAPLHAQRLLSVGLGGGIALPLSTFSDEVVPGFRALGTLAVGAPLYPLGLRIDGAYDRFDVEAAPAGSVDFDGAQRVVSATINPTYRLPSAGAPISPYLIAGAGAYNVGCTGDYTCESSTHFGWNAGAGFTFRAFGFRAFAEARYHRVEASGGGVQYVPVTAGLLF